MTSRRYTMLYTTTAYPLVKTWYSFSSEEDLLSFEKSLMKIKELADTCAGDRVGSRRWMIATNKFAYRWGTGNIPVDIFMCVKEFSDDSHPDPSQRIHLLVINSQSSSYQNMLF